MKLINQGEVENVGPNLPNGSSSGVVDRGASSLPPPKARNKTSRFKINRGGTTQLSEQITGESPSTDIEPPTPVASTVTERRGSLRLETDQQTRSPLLSPNPDTPLTVVERSSPKLPSGDIPSVTKILPPARISRKPPRPSQSTTSAVHELATASGTVRERTPTPSKTQPTMVADSPSFKPPPSMIIDSPSFAPSEGHSAIFPSMIVDSPDFPPPKGVSPTPTNKSRNAPAEPRMIDSPSFPVEPTNPRPPRVMSSRVVERSPAGGSQQRADASGKVSRFAAERR